MIQKHAARALHYDLRLEVGGVFKSWAVPKGPPLVPGEKHLAVQVEDHPLEYGTFEGVIPKGEYGGGTVMLWDRGRFESPDRRTDLAAGKIELLLDGEKLHGAWTLVRMGGKQNASGKNWLLIKRHDTTETTTSAPSNLSVASGRSMREIARARDRTWSQSGETAAAPKMAAEVPSARPLDGAVRRRLPASMAPQLAVLVKEPPDGANWVHEIKFDGYRILARLERGKVTLLSRNGLDWTKRFPEIANALAGFAVRTAMLDGEVVAMSQVGTSSFRDLQHALSTQHTDGLVYQVFDLLHLDGYDLTNVALVDRKRTLMALAEAAGFAGDGRIRYTDHIEERGPRFFREACRLGLEGIVSKRRDAPYRELRSRSWLKTKCTHHEDLVIGGYTDPRGARSGFGALLLGAFGRSGELVYVGRVGTGFDAHTLKDLTARLKKIESTDSPFTSRIRHERGLHWVQPRLVADVEFTERTGDGLLRHPAFRGMREDKDPSEVRTGDRVKVAAPVKAPRARRAAAAKRPRDSAATVAGVKLTHPERVLYPQPGITKLHLAQYYEAIEPWIMPMLVDRPLALLRCPDGCTGTCFFQKHPGSTMSAEIPRVAIREKTAKTSYMYVTQLSDVIRLVQMGVLELHVWGSRVGHLEQPDIMVFDLDPGPGVAWAEVIAGAKDLKEMLAGLELESFPRLTGGKGLHVVVPLVPADDWDTVKDFSYAAAQALTRAAPTRFTTNMAKAKRPRKIFIDYLRNGRGATAIASYSTRAHGTAPVAMPLRWEELGAATVPDRYTVLTARRRLGALSADPWDGFDQARRTLNPTAKKMLGLPAPSRTRRTRTTK